MVARCEPPQVFGVHGDWGSGKTSFLHQLQWQLTGECPQQREARREDAAVPTDPQKHVAVVWFEAWRYQYEQAPIVALLQEIRSQLPWTAKVRDAMSKIGETTVRSALLAIEDITKKIGIQASKIQESGEKWEKDHLATTLPSHFVREHLEREIGRLIRTDDSEEGRDPSERLVVIVDDLDRCDPAAAYALLEGIKIYLNLPNCVFVLGMNQKVVEKAIADQLPAPRREDGRWIRLKSREYLEKICQNISQLPLVDDPWELLYRFLDGFEHRERIRDMAREYRFLPHNARKIKSFANLLLRNARRIEESSPSAETDEEEELDRWARLTMTMACLNHFHPEIYRHLQAYRLDYFQTLREWCLAPQADDDRTHHSLRSLGPAFSVAEEDADDDTAPAPTFPTPRQSLFPDPVEGGVLRVQRLIAELDTVTESDIDRHLVF